MTRTPRVEYPGALYHVTARGVQRGAIFLDDSDRRQLLRLLASTMNAGNAHAFAYCLMGNHYHFVIQTREANLSALMHRINFSYSQAFNRRHGAAATFLKVDSRPFT
jgi:putative transposase